MERKEGRGKEWRGKERREEEKRGEEKREERRGEEEEEKEEEERRGEERRSEKKREKKRGESRPIRAPRQGDLCLIRRSRSAEAVRTGIHIRYGPGSGCTLILVFVARLCRSFHKLLQFRKHSSFLIAPRWTCALILYELLLCRLSSSMT